MNLFHKTKDRRTDVSDEEVEPLGSGWGAEAALAIALYASLLFENGFKKGVLLSVNHSGDSDSTGSITGNILGLINGYGRIPLRWRARGSVTGAVPGVPRPGSIRPLPNSHWELPWPSRTGTCSLFSQEHDGKKRLQGSPAFPAECAINDTTGTAVTDRKGITITITDNGCGGCPIYKGLVPVAPET